MRNPKKKIFNYHSKIKVDTRYASYFEYMIHTPEMLSSIKKIRKEFNIPEEGIGEFPSTVDSTNIDKIIASTDFDVPNHISSNPLFINRIAELCAKFGFPENDWFYTLEEFVVFDHYDPSTFGRGYKILNFKKILNSNINIKTLSSLEEYSKTLPVAILIDSYTSLTELHDLVDKVFKTEIAPLQQETRNPDSKMNKIKRITPKMIPIFELIKNNLNLPSREIAAKINRKFKLNWDYTRVDKIIREKKYKRVI